MIQFKINIPIIPLGVDTNLFDSSRFSMNKIRADLKFNEDLFLLFYSGKISPQKGIEKLLLILYELDKKYNVGLLVVGSGSQNYVTKITKYVEKLRLKNKVKFIPFVNHKDLPKLMACSNLGCWIGNISSASLNEMIGIGKPIIANIFEGFDLESLGYSFAKKYRSLNDSIAWISGFISNRENYMNVCNEAREYALNHLDWEITTNKVFNLYD